MNSMSKFAAKATIKNANKIKQPLKRKKSPGLHLMGIFILPRQHPPIEV